MLELLSPVQMPDEAEVFADRGFSIVERMKRLFQR